MEMELSFLSPKTHVFFCFWNSSVHIPSSPQIPNTIFCFSEDHQFVDEIVKKKRKRKMVMVLTRFVKKIVLVLS